MNGPPEKPVVCDWIYCLYYFIPYHVDLHVPYVTQYENTFVSCKSSIMFMYFIHPHHAAYMYVKY